MDKINKHKIPYLYKGNPFLGTFGLVPFQNNLFDNDFYRIIIYYWNDKTTKNK